MTNEDITKNLDCLGTGSMLHHEVIKRFCALSTEVMNKKFNNQVSADCFCAQSPFNRPDLIQFYHFDEQIIAFIENAVRERLRLNS